MALMGSTEASALAEVILTCATSDFGMSLARFAATAAAFDMSCIFAFSKIRPPALIYDGYSETIDRKALQSYLRGACLLDPFYSACVNGHAEGLWRMRDLAPDAFYESEFAWSSEVHPCISDQAGTLIEEIGYIVPLRPGEAATFSLMRNRDSMPFSTEEFANLETLVPIVSAFIRQHYSATNADQADGHNLRPNADAVFGKAFGDLTQAQCSVTKLILSGHSNISIATILGITEGTVKMHRYNIYKRLNISSQAELFQLFIGQLTE